MPGENVQDWSITAANNGTADTSINWAEGQARASVNNSARSQMAAHAKDRNLRNGSIVTSGTADAQTFNSGLSYTATPTGLRVLLKIGPGLTNTGPMTLNMDGIGAVTVSTQFSQPLTAGMVQGAAYAEFVYTGSVWVLMGAPGTQMIHGGDGTTSLPSGYIGEYYATTNSAGAILTAGNYANLHVATMNAGDWDIRGKVRMTGTVGAGVYIGLSTTSGSGSSSPDSISNNFFTANGDLWSAVGPARFLLTANTNVYLVGYPIAADCALHTAIIQARRVQ